MKKLVVVLLIQLGIIFNISARDNELERSIVVVIASYNNSHWFQWNLDSVFAQQYANYHVIYIDDFSGDGTYSLVKNYIEQKGYRDRVTLIGNHTRCGALANQNKAIMSCKDTDIIVILDGDDRFAHEQVLSYINDVYADPDVWLTYGQFKEYPSGTRGFCRRMPLGIVANNAFRDFSDIPSHLRTFYAGLFKKIKKEDLMYKGEFLKMTGDIAAMFPMIEMARDHFKFIPEILYEYNAANPINDHKVSKTIQRDMDLFIRSKRRYDKITLPFE